MSNYTQIVSYGPKDSLSHGDPNKALKGVQIDAELGAISTAIATKVDGPLQNIAVSGTANNYGATITGSDTANQSFGLSVAAGSSSSDFALSVTTPGSSPLFRVRGDGHLFAGSVDFTPFTGSFTGTFSGGIVATTTVKYVTNGLTATIYFPSLVSATTNSPSVLTMTGAPAILAPATTQMVPMFGVFDNNAVGGFTILSAVTVNHSGSIVFDRTGVSASLPGVASVTNGFAVGSAGKGIVAGSSFTFALV